MPTTMCWNSYAQLETAYVNGKPVNIYHGSATVSAPGDCAAFPGGTSGPSAYAVMLN